MNIELTIDTIEALIKKKEQALLAYPNSKNMIEEIQILKNILSSISSFIKKDYNPLASFAQEISQYIRKHSISQDELYQIIRSKETTATDKKNAIISASANAYFEMYQEADSKYTELYFLISNWHLDTAMLCITNENEKYELFNERLKKFNETH